MKFEFINNSVVILGNIHNPSLISEGFLLKIGILKDFAELNKQNIFITPAISQFTVKMNTFSIEPLRLHIISPVISEEPYDYANKYCIALPHIKSKAIGINFVVKVTEFDVKTWFNKRNLTKIHNSNVNNIVFSVPFDGDNICILTIQNNNDFAIVDLNFHHPFNDIPLSDINIDFVEKWGKYKVLVEEYIPNLFN